MSKNSNISPYQEQFDRVKRFYEKINPHIKNFGDQKVYEDNLYTFFQNAWHLKDYIKNDSTFSLVDIEFIVETYPVLMVCADIANKSKHLSLNYKRMDVKHTRTDVHLKLPSMDVILRGSGKIQNTIPADRCIAHYNYYFTDKTGKEYDAIILGEEIINAWKDIIRNYIIPFSKAQSKCYPNFKERARRHQIKYREEILKVDHGEFNTFLTDADSQRGLIFYDGFGIFKAALERYPDFKLNKACFVNMLRSEHIPFNFFIPLAKDPVFAKAMLNRFLGGIISNIKVILIEHAPDPEIALKDRTSFDTYVEYDHIDGTEGILGIEVKYTEEDYPLKEESTEAKAIRNPKHPYNVLTRKLGLYNKEAIEDLKKDRFRQVWRNQLLGESITRKNHHEFRFEHFTSVILYPEGNDHFRKLIPEYKSFLTPGNENSFMGITYEEFIKTAMMLTVNPEYLKWIQYLKERYIF